MKKADFWGEEVFQVDRLVRQLIDCPRRPGHFSQEGVISGQKRLELFLDKGVDVAEGALFWFCSPRIGGAGRELYFTRKRLVGKG